MRNTRTAVAAVVTLGLLAGSGCSLSSSSDDETSGSKQVVVATHESWAMPKSVL